MAEVTKQFGFWGTTSSERLDSNRWAFSAGGATGMTAESWAGSGDSPNDPGEVAENKGGGIFMKRTGKNLTNGAPFWEWTGTLEQLGVPSGATVTAMNLSYDWEIFKYVTGAASTVGPAELRNSSSTLLKTFSTALEYSGDTGWATRAGTNQTGLSLAANTTIKLRLNGLPKTGNNNGAENEIDFDWVVVTITYTPAGGSALKLEPSDSASLSDSVGRAVAIAKSDGASLSDSAFRAIKTAATDSISVIDALIKNFSKKSDDAAALADAAQKAVARVSSDEISLVDAAMRAVSLIVGDSIELTDEAKRAVTTMISDGAALEDVVIKAVELQRKDETTLGDSISKSVAAIKKDGAALSDFVEVFGSAVSDLFVVLPTKATVSPYVRDAILTMEKHGASVSPLDNQAAITPLRRFIAVTSALRRVAIAAYERLARLR